MHAYGSPWVPYRFLWAPMDPLWMYYECLRGALWVPYDPLQVPIGTYGSLWVPRVPHGSPMDPYGSLWVPMGAQMARSPPEDHP